MEELSAEEVAEHFHRTTEGLPEALQVPFLDHLTRWLFDKGCFLEIAAVGRRRGWQEESIHALLTGHANNRGIDPLWPWFGVYVVPNW